MGRTTKHLGIKYEWLTDGNGQEYVVATMRDLCEVIVHITEKHLGRTVKEHDSTPARPNETLEQDESGVVNDKMYRTIARKIIYLTHKLMIEGINTARKRSKFFMRPQKHHWRTVEQFVGYLKQEMDGIKLTYRRPL